jgi:hypothetical protein
VISSQTTLQGLQNGFSFNPQHQGFENLTVAIESLVMLSTSSGASPDERRPPRLKMHGLLHFDIPITLLRLGMTGLPAG